MYCRLAVTLEFRRDPIGLWDSKGIRIYFSKQTGVIQYLDCVFAPSDILPELNPKQPFSGVLRVDGVETSKKTTQASLQGRTTGKLHDHASGFTVVFPHHGASFTLTKDRKGLEMVRFSSR